MARVLFTIGFTKTTAERFFETLRRSGVQAVIDVRLRTSSQLAGFAKAQDLAYFLRVVAGIDYRPEPSLAPTGELLDGYRRGVIEWAEYEERYLALLEGRRVAERLDPLLFAQGCLLCSEASPEHCHRRLAAEYLAARWGDLEIRHLRP